MAGALVLAMQKPAMDPNLIRFSLTMHAYRRAIAAPTAASNLASSNGLSM
jgi:hypothetical protein